MVDMKTEIFDNHALLTLKGDFVGVEEVEELRSQFKKLAEDNKNLIIDLSGVSYLNSTSLGAFLSANALYEKGGGKALVCNASPYIKNIFDITKLTLIFNLYGSKEDAVKTL